MNIIKQLIDEYKQVTKKFWKTSDSPKWKSLKKYDMGDDCDLYELDFTLKELGGIRISTYKGQVGSFHLYFFKNADKLCKQSPNLSFYLDYINGVIEWFRKWKKKQKGNWDDPKTPYWTAGSIGWYDEDLEEYL